MIIANMYAIPKPTAPQHAKPPQQAADNKTTIQKPNACPRRDESEQATDKTNNFYPEFVMKLGSRKSHSICTGARRGNTMEAAVKLPASATKKALHPRDLPLALTTGPPMRGGSFGGGGGGRIPVLRRRSPPK